MRGGGSSNMTSMMMMMMMRFCMASCAMTMMGMGPLGGLFSGLFSAAEGAGDLIGGAGKGVGKAASGLGSVLSGEAFEGPSLERDEGLTNAIQRMGPPNNNGGGQGSRPPISFNRL
jgi:hypothetical protein